VDLHREQSYHYSIYDTAGSAARSDKYLRQTILEEVAVPVRHPNEGDCFTVAVSNGECAYGVVSRVSPNGIMVAYFFPSSVATGDELPSAALRAEDAVLVARVGSQGITSGKWKVVGPVLEFDRELWPVPAFARRPPLVELAFRVTYDDANIEDVESEERVPLEEAEGLPRDGLWGDVAVERFLEHTGV
jgi:hypothetical protein